MVVRRYFFQGPVMASVNPGSRILRNIVLPSGEKQTPVKSDWFRAFQANL